MTTAHHGRLSHTIALWRWPYVVALLATIPAFYLSLNPAATLWPEAIYATCAVLSALRLGHLLMRSAHHWRATAKTHALDAWILLAALVSSILPASALSESALAWRMLTALLILLRLVSLFRGLFTQAGLIRLLAMATVVLMLCGLGFYWLDPAINSYEDGLWLAFITAATVGYGDVVPTTTASRIFSIFVVLLGCGVLSLVTASVAAMFVKSQERQIEREILHELHHEIKALRQDVEALRRDAQAARSRVNTGVEDTKTDPNLTNYSG